MKNDIVDTLRKKKKRKDYTRITRKFKSGFPSNIEEGIVHNYSTELIQLLDEEDFQINSTNIFPVKDIKKFRFNKNDKYYNLILHKEKIQKKIKKVSTPNLGSWKKMFASLKLDCLIIETEKSKSRTFHIGGVIKVKRKGIDFLYFNAQGKVETDPYFIKYSDITKVILDSNYAKVFKKYVHT